MCTQQDDDGGDDEEAVDETWLEFHSNHGANVELSNDDLTATRSAGFNYALVLSHKPLPKNALFKVSLAANVERACYDFTQYCVHCKNEMSAHGIEITVLQKRL